MNFITTSSLLLVVVLITATTTSAATAAAAISTATRELQNSFIRSAVIKLQNTEPEILEQDVFNDATANYQSLALDATTRFLPNPSIPTPSVVDIRNFYTLSCIYYSTNGVGNPRTDVLLPAGAPIPNWITEDGWLNGDYCNWHGIKCDRNTRDVTDIELYSNGMYGQWPNEIVLLKDTLELIDLYDNFYLWSWEPKWMLKMKALKYLYFGTTSFDALGIPEYLSGCTNLLELDFSYSYWGEGPIRDGAFRDLTSLYYLSMGNNIYYAEDGKMFPDSFSMLPLEFFYMESSTFKGINNKLELDFLLDWSETLRIVYLDFTEFKGSTLPSSLNQLTTLEQFSVPFTNLEGRLPSELSTLPNLEYLWLYGNEFTGVIPQAWGNNDAFPQLSILFLEGETNRLTGTLPSSLCVAGGNSNILELGANCNVCGTSDDGCCSCCGSDCENLSRPTPSPTPVAIGASIQLPLGFCFSGDSTVQVQNKGAVTMFDLQLGDRVKVNTNNNNDSFEPIYSFGHKDSTVSANYLRITTTTTSSQPLELSKDHMLVIEKEGKQHHYVPASSIEVGDVLLVVASSDNDESITNTNSAATVIRIESVTRKGAFAPFTPSGTIVVNDILASNYIAYQGSEYLRITSLFTFSYQWLAHSFTSIHRLVLKLGLTTTEAAESYNADNGISVWVETPHRLFSWALSQQHYMIAVPLLLIAISVIGIVSLIEKNIGFVIVVVGLSFVLVIRQQARKKKLML